MSGIGSHTRPIRGRTDNWLTPPIFVAELGPFDLDPCAASGRPVSHKCAKKEYFSAGEEKPWEGRVWMNPPYGDKTGIWLKKLSQHGRGTALVFARTETDMFRDFVWPKATALRFLYRRIHFHTLDGKRASGNSGGPSVLIAYGVEDAIHLMNARWLGGKFIFNT